MKARFIFAAALIIIGAMFLLDRLQIWIFSDIISTWWPLIIIAVGLIQLANSSKAMMPGIFIVCIGALLQANELDFLPWGFWGTLWPLLLILIGLSLLTGHSHIHGHKKSESASDEMNLNAIFSGIEQKIKTEDFRGGSVFVAFGGAEIDLRDCIICSEGATLELNCYFGGINIRVPQNWKVETTGLPLFGGMDNKCKLYVEDIADASVLKIRYNVMFGGIEFRN